MLSVVKNLFKKSKDENLEDKADDVLQLTPDYKLLRVNDKAIITDSKNQIINEQKDTLPDSPARAAYESLKTLENMDLLKKSSKEIWTCGFRDNEQRWVWYKNSQPKITLSYNEAFKEDSLENKFQFNSINYGISVIGKIQSEGLEKVAKEMNALVLGNSYTKIACTNCKCQDNYTIDDLVDESKQAKYDSNFVICTSCNNLIKLEA
jgi:hypothetical protein